MGSIDLGVSGASNRQRRRLSCAVWQCGVSWSRQAMVLPCVCVRAPIPEAKAKQRQSEVVVIRR